MTAGVDNTWEFVERGVHIANRHTCKLMRVHQAAVAQPSLRDECALQQSWSNQQVHGMHIRSNILLSEDEWYPRYGLMSCPSFKVRSAKICIVDREILKLASSPSVARKRRSFESVGSSTSLS